MASWFAKPAKWFVGRYCYEVFQRREESCSDCPGTACLMTGNLQVSEALFVRENGSQSNVRVSAVPITGRDSGERGFIEVVEDITELKRAEEERQRMQGESLGVAGGIAHDSGSDQEIFR